jgi:hypothetical protein
MNATDIFSSYEDIAKTLSFVQVKDRTKDSMTIQFDPENGSGTVRLYGLFPGILIGFNDFSVDSFPSYNGEIAEGLKINFCVEGRCEAKMSDEKYLFMEPGDLSIDTRTVEEQFAFPNGIFTGSNCLFMIQLLNRRLRFYSKKPALTWAIFVSGFVLAIRASLRNPAAR